MNKNQIKQEIEYAQRSIDLAKAERERTWHSREQAILTNAIGYLNAITNCLNEAAGMTENNNELEQN